MGKIVRTMDWKVIKGTVMTDGFLREIRDTHQLRKDIRTLSLAKAEEFMKRLGG
jgi:hypothetical protein